MNKYAKRLIAKSKNGIAPTAREVGHTYKELRNLYPEKDWREICAMYGLVPRQKAMQRKEGVGKGKSRRGDLWQAIFGSRDVADI